MKTKTKLLFGIILMLLISGQVKAQNSYPVSGKALIEGLDITNSRSSNSSNEGINLGSSSVTSFQLTHDGWSGTHALLFNAYKSQGDPSGNLAGANNTQFANDVGAYNGGAGSIMFFGNGGSMNFYISNASTGKDTFVDWGVPKMTIRRNGNVGIGTNSPNQKLTVAGTINSKEIIVEETAGADFVFADDYDLPTLEELEAFIDQNNHLPGIAPATQMIEEGVKVGELQIQLLQKIEELTLHVIQLNKENQELKERVEQLEEQ